MANPPSPRNSRHRPQQEPRKLEGDYRGRATRKSIPSEDVKNPVQEVFADAYKPKSGWVARTDASTAVNFGVDNPRGGMAK